jgi:hypothetical protein
LYLTLAIKILRQGVLYALTGEVAEEIFQLCFQALFGWYIADAMVLLEALSRMTQQIG